VVGVLLEPEATIDGTIFCSALEQALSLVPSTFGEASGAR